VAADRIDLRLEGVSELDHPSMLVEGRRESRPSTE
jgi:hypothetical protein